MTHIFIVNPYAGEKTFADDLRRKLKEIKNLKYFVFNTKRVGVGSSQPYFVGNNGPFFVGKLGANQ